jgi:hypothetical protein
VLDSGLVAIEGSGQELEHALVRQLGVIGTTRSVAGTIAAQNTEVELETGRNVLRHSGVCRGTRVCCWSVLGRKKQRAVQRFNKDG